MQKLTQNVLIEKAVALLESGTVDRVLGWRRGEFFYDVTPSVFTDGADLKENFVWNSFCGANFSKYLISETRKS